MRVLVTGATGLLGRGVAASLVERGDDVIALVRRTSGPLLGTSRLVHDLLEPFPPSAFPDVDCVVHLAHHPYVTFPEHATALHRLNTGSTQELLEAARRKGVARFVYASSGAVYGYSDHAMDEHEPTNPMDFYALTKLQAEALVEAYSTYFDTVIVRPFFPYGRGQPVRLIPRLAERIARSEAIGLHEGDRPRLNPIFVDDAVAGIVAAVDGRAPRFLNLAGPNVVSVRELALAIAEVVGGTPIFEATGQHVGGDMVGATNALEEVLARPLVSLEAGLREALASGRARV